MLVGLVNRQMELTVNVLCLVEAAVGTVFGNRGFPAAKLDK
jgi:hypothetical protein